MQNADPSLTLLSRTWVLLASTIAVGMGQTVVFAVIPMLGRELKLHEVVVTLPWGGQWMLRELAITSLSAMSALVYTLVAPMWGRLSDRVGRKPVLIAGMLGHAAGTLLFNSAAYAGLTGVLSGGLLYFALLMTRLMHATVMSAAQPATSAYMADITTIATRTRGLSQISSGNQIGAMTGPALAYFTVLSFLAPLFLQASICLLCGILIWLFLPEPPRHAPPLSAVKAKKLGLLDPRYRVYLFGGLIAFCCLGMVQQTLGFYFQDRLHLASLDAARRYSYAMMLSSACMIVSQLLIVQRVALTPFALMRIGLPLCCAGYGMLALADTQWMLFTGMALFGLGIGLSGAGYSAGATMHVESHEQGALAGLVGSSSGLGFVIGPIAGGMLYGIDGRLPYLTAALLILPMAVYAWCMKD